jgi:hypothetical protein
VLQRESYQEHDIRGRECAVAVDVDANLHLGLNGPHVALAVGVDGGADALAAGLGVGHLLLAPTCQWVPQTSRNKRCVASLTWQKSVSTSTRVLAQGGAGGARSARACGWGDEDLVEDGLVAEGREGGRGREKGK